MGCSPALDKQVLTNILHLNGVVGQRELLEGEVTGPDVEGGAVSQVIRVIRSHNQILAQSDRVVGW